MQVTTKMMLTKILDAIKLACVSVMVIWFITIGFAIWNTVTK